VVADKVGATFYYVKKAYEIYNAYAGKIGFSIRKSHTKHRADTSLSQKYIVCSNEGHRENTKSS
jgi:zinc finger SWIM domain-containing protein 3